MKVNDDKTKTLQLLSVLYGESSDDNIKDRLARKYFDLMKRTDIFLELQEMINETVTYNDDGKKVILRSDNIRKAAVNGIEKGIAVFEDLEKAMDRIQEQYQKTEQELQKIIPQSSRISLVAKQQEWVADVFYDTLLNALIYILTVKYGAKVLTDIYYKQDMDLLDKMLLVENCLQINMSTVEKDQSISDVSGNDWWMIRSKRFNLLGMCEYNGYRVSVMNKNNDIKSFVMSMQEKLHNISPYLYASRVHDPMKEDDLLLIGKGYIVGRGVSDALHFLEGNVIIEPSISTMDNVELEISDLLNILSSCLGTKNYCISPEVLVDMLNSKAMNSVTRNRMSNNKCIFCGADAIQGMAYCNNHFRVNR